MLAQSSFVGKKIEASSGVTVSKNGVLCCVAPSPCISTGKFAFPKCSYESFLRLHVV